MSNCLSEDIYKSAETIAKYLWLDKDVDRAKDKEKITNTVRVTGFASLDELVATALSKTISDVQQNVQTYLQKRDFEAKFIRWRDDEDAQVFRVYASSCNVAFVFFTQTREVC